MRDAGHWYFYRDDGLAVLCKRSDSQFERIKKSINKAKYHFGEIKQRELKFIRHIIYISDK